MEYAGFWRRFAANLIDSMITTIPGMLFGAFGAGFSATGIGLGFIIGFLYRPFFESSILRGTPGKALMNIVVVSENGDRLTFKQACIRFFCAYLSALILYIGYLMQPFTARRQTLHDMIAETVVIKNTELSQDLNYFSVWKDQFKEIVSRL